MNTDTLLSLARSLIADVDFSVMITAGPDGASHARIVQPRAPGTDWTVDILTNRRCRKVRDIERTDQMTMLYQHDRHRAYVSLMGRATLIDDLALKRSRWTAAHYRWNPAGPDDPDTLYIRLATDRIELWSAAHDVMPEPQGYSAAVLMRDGDRWQISAT